MFFCVFSISNFQKLFFLQVTHPQGVEAHVRHSAAGPRSKEDERVRLRLVPSGLAWLFAAGMCSSVASPPAKESHLPELCAEYNRLWGSQRWRELWQLLAAKWMSHYLQGIKGRTLWVHWTANSDHVHSHVFIYIYNIYIYITYTHTSTTIALGREVSGVRELRSAMANTNGGLYMHQTNIYLFWWTMDDAYAELVWWILTIWIDMIFHLFRRAQ